MIRSVWVFFPKEILLLAGKETGRRQQIGSANPASGSECRFIRVKPGLTTLKDDHQPRLMARRTGEPAMQEAATLNSIPATPPAAAPVAIPNVDVIIRAERIEKYYAQPSHTER